jgi:hypothetical protein
MLDKNKIEFAAQKWAMDNGKKFPHLSVPEFIAGAMWAIQEIEREAQNPASCQTVVSSKFFIPESAQEWLLKGDRGISSETIFGAITGLWINNYKYPPADPSDFYRCSKLLKAVPEWKSELSKVAKLSETWKKVIDNWEKLSELLEEQIEWRDKGISASNGMYDFMKQLGC